MLLFPMRVSMMKNKKVSLKKILPSVIEIAQRAGKKLKKTQKNLDQLNITTKEAQGVVSEADIQAEKYIIKKLKNLIPEADFLGEESFFEVQKNDPRNNYEQFKNKEWLWVIDPLDGTTNYLNCMDYFAVCIGLMHKGKTVLGVVYRPITDEIFFATEKGGSFYRKDKKRKINLKKSVNKKSLSDSLVVTGFASEKHQHEFSELELFYKIMKETRGVRRMGSAALDLCFVASGVFDAFWEAGLAPWDVCAAGIICREAGVEISDYAAREFDPFAGNFIAARRPVMENFQKLIIG